MHWISRTPSALLDTFLLLLIASKVTCVVKLLIGINLAHILYTIKGELFIIFLSLEVFCRNLSHSSCLHVSHDNLRVVIFCLEFQILLLCTTRHDMFLASNCSVLTESVY